MPPAPKPEFENVFWNFKKTVCELEHNGNENEKTIYKKSLDTALSRRVRNLHRRLHIGPDVDVLHT
jgi:hypothetical protein